MPAQQQQPPEGGAVGVPLDMSQPRPLPPSRPVLQAGGAASSIGGAAEALLRRSVWGARRPCGGAGCAALRCGGVAERELSHIPVSAWGEYPYALAGPGFAPAWPQGPYPRPQGLGELLYPLFCTARPSGPAEVWSVQVTGNPACADPASWAVSAVRALWPH